MRRLLALTVLALVLTACGVVPPTATLTPSLPPTTSPASPPGSVSPSGSASPSASTAAPVPTSPSASPAGGCTITAARSVDIFFRASASSGRFGRLRATESVEATVQTADGFYGFEPGVAQADNIGLFRMRWVLKTHDLTTSSGCAELPVVTAPISGICYAMITVETPIHSRAATSSSVLVTLQPDDYVMVRSRARSWYLVDLNVGTAGTDVQGFLAADQLGGLSGPCSGL